MGRRNRRPSRPSALVLLHLKAVLVDEAMVAATEAQKVAELRLAAARPRHDVVAIDVAIRAAREATAAVAQAECAAQRRRDGAPAATDVEWVPAEILDDATNRRIAAQPLDGRGASGVPSSSVPHPRDRVGEIGLHLRGRRPRPAERAVRGTCQVDLRHGDEGIGSLQARWNLAPSPGGGVTGADVRFSASSSPPDRRRRPARDSPRKRLPPSTRATSRTRSPCAPPPPPPA